MVGLWSECPISCCCFIFIFFQIPLRGQFPTSTGRAVVIRISPPHIQGVFFTSMQQCTDCFEDTNLLSEYKSYLQIESLCPLESTTVYTETPPSECFVRQNTLLLETVPSPCQYQGHCFHFLGYMKYIISDHTILLPAPSDRDTDIFPTFKFINPRRSRRSPLQLVI